jgi:hypothetical protein
MSPDTQRSIESFFKEYGIIDADQKAKILPEITNIIYSYNMAVVKAEKETDEYKKKQALIGVKEWHSKIDEIFTDFLNKR